MRVTHRRNVFRQDGYRINDAAENSAEVNFMLIKIAYRPGFERTLRGSSRSSRAVVHGEQQKTIMTKMRRFDHRSLIRFHRNPHFDVRKSCRVLFEENHSTIEILDEGRKDFKRFR